MVKSIVDPNDPTLVLSKEDVTLHFRALSDKDIDELDAWLRATYLKTVRQSLREDIDLTLEEREMELQIAHHQAASMSWMSRAGARQMATPLGMAKLCYQHLVDNDKAKVTLAELRQMLTDPDNVDMVNREIEDINDSDYRSGALTKIAEGEGEKGGKAKKQSGRLSKTQRKLRRQQKQRDKRKSRRKRKSTKP